VTPAIDVTLRIGGVFASDRPAVVRTVVGSCIAACLYDPVSRVGGMNHYMLPYDEDVLTHDDPTRFGLHAMEVLLGSMQKLGARRERVQAKLFGGGHVLASKHSDQSVPMRNIAFIREYVREERLLVLAEDLGGRHGRAIQFYTETGKALIKRLPRSQAHQLPLLDRSVPSSPPPPHPSDITLFDD
jgi:chemotaxis protein CheD